MHVINAKQTLTPLKSFKFFTLILIALGIIFRVFHFIYNRSLWMDEVYLASSLLHMDYEGLMLKPLEYQQKAPIAFLLTVKTFVYLFGNTEMALRLISLLSGIASMFVFIPVSKFFVGERSTLIGLGMLAFAHPLVFHSVEIKQYSTEMLMMLIAFYCYVRYHKKTSTMSLINWGIIGCVIVWFSYSSVFILMGIAAALTINRIINKQWSGFWPQSLTFVTWLISFAVNYFLFTHKHAESKWIVYWFDFYRTFIPFPPTSLADLKWYPLNLYRVMDYPLGMLWKLGPMDSLLMKLLKLTTVLALVCLISGLVSIYKRKSVFVLLCVPFLLMFIASGLKLYPLTERFWVFISPMIILFVAQGCVWLTERIRFDKLSIFLPGMLLIVPFANSLHYILQPKHLLDHKRSFQREAVAFLNTQCRPGDVVYVYWNDLPGFKIYKSITPYKFVAIEGKDYRLTSGSYAMYLNKLKQDIKSIQNAKRIWVMYNDYYRTDIGDLIDQPEWYYIKNEAPVDRFLNYMSTLGEQKEIFRSFDVKINLVTLKGIPQL